MKISNNYKLWLDIIFDADTTSATLCYNKKFYIHIKNNPKCLQQGKIVSQSAILSWSLSPHFILFTQMINTCTYMYICVGYFSKTISQNTRNYIYMYLHTHAHTHTHTHARTHTHTHIYIYREREDIFRKLHTPPLALGLRPCQVILRCS